MTASPDPRIDNAVIDAIEAYCRDVLAPKAAEIDAQSIFTTCHLESLAAMGVMGLNLPATLGGAGLDPHTLFEAVGAIAGACGSTAQF